MPPPRQPGIFGPGGILSKLPQILGGIFGGGRPTPTNGRYPPGTRPPGAGPFGDIAQDDWLYIAAAGVLLLAPFQKKKKKKGPEHKKPKLLAALNRPLKTSRRNRTAAKSPAPNLNPGFKQ